MNRTRLLMIGVLALALGFLVSIYVYKNLQSRSGISSDPGIDVIVAADDLSVGARVEEHDIKIIRIPVADLPPGAPRRRSDVLGHGVIIPITKGEFILPTKLAGENAGSGLPSLIPPGMRAVSVTSERGGLSRRFCHCRDTGRCPADRNAERRRPSRRQLPFYRMSQCWPPVTNWNAPRPAKPKTQPSLRFWCLPTMPSGSRSPVPRERSNSLCAIRSTRRRRTSHPPAPEACTSTRRLRRRPSMLRFIARFR